MFETTVLVNEDALLEIKNYLVAPRNKWFCILLVLGGILIVFGSAVAIAELDFGYDGYFVIFFVVLFIVGLLLAITMLINYFRQGNVVVKTIVKRFQESGHSEMKMVASFTDDKINVQNLTSGANGEVDYAVVYRFSETKNFFTLFTKAGQSIMVNKTSLIEAGEDNKFLQFAKGKLRCFR